MPVYTHTEFDGHFPVGSSAVVVADNKKEAAELLNARLEQIGLEPTAIEDEFEKVKTRTKQVIILNDGSY